MKPTPHSKATRLLVFFIHTLVPIILLSASFLPTFAMENLGLFLFSFSIIITYSVVYLLPAGIITMGSFWLLNGWQKKHASKTIDMVIYGIAIITTSLTLFILFTDRVVFRLFNFHLNGFVLNLMTTPGGLDSMGGSNSTTLTYVAIGLAILGVQTLLLAISILLYRYKNQAINRYIHQYRILTLLLFIILATSQALIYGISSFKNNLPVIHVASALPLYQPLTMKGLAKKLGFKKSYTKQLNLKPGEGSLVYPLQPLEIEKPTKPLNIVWLVAESWRFDMLTEEIMPKMSSFAQQTSRFEQHYSGGNGTRMGLFSQFYGLYGSYWFQFLNERKSPLVMDILQQQEYQLSLYTSAEFSYPEFDRTLFSAIPREFLHEPAKGLGWQRDRENVTNMLSYLDKRDTNRPFMTFMFFESPHARYYFPEEDAIRTPYLEDFNYATMSLEKDIDLIFNRYVNACHHLDSQLGRITDYLKKEDLLDNTIVIITGDHGEEFLENGHWGHNSEFTEQQVRVPLLLLVPGVKPQKVQRMTSHLDIPATLLPLLGVKNPAKEYSLGYDLLNGEERKYTIVADWSRCAYIDDQFKFITNFSNRSIAKSYVTTKQDAPIPSDKVFWDTRKATMLNVLLNLQLFLTGT